MEMKILSFQAKEGRIQVVGKKFMLLADQMFFKLDCQPIKKFMNNCNFKKLYQFNNGQVENYPTSNSILISDIYKKIMINMKYTNNIIVKPFSYFFFYKLMFLHT